MDKLINLYLNRRRSIKDLFIYRNAFYRANKENRQQLVRNLVAMKELPEVARDVVDYFNGLVIELE